VLFPRVLGATFVLDVSVAQTLGPYLLAPFAVGVLALVMWLRRAPDVTHLSDTPRNPLQIGSAVQMAVTFQVVLFAVGWVRRTFGDVGLLVSGAVLGLTDVDALTISMARSAASGVAAHIAAQAIAIGILANCVLKLTLALTFGTSRFRRVSGIALAAMALAIVASIVSLR
jgi:uncharacterized membrane protein (DUF4010 family)